MARDCHVAHREDLSKRLVNVLLIEDNQAEARLLQELLKGALFNRFQLTHVQRLGAGIDLLIQPSSAQLEAAFDVILLDLTLPDSYGIASLESLLHYAPQLPIVVLTNTNDDELAIVAVRCGAQDYLVKRHVTQESLVRSLRYAIERKQSAEALREANEVLEHRVQERTAELETANYLLKQEIAWRQTIQERLELAQKAGKIGSFEWNIESRIFIWTAELEALYGLTAGSFNNQYESWLQTLHPDDRATTEAELFRAVQTGQDLDTEFRIVCPNGDLRWIAIKGSLFSDPTTGTPLRLLGIHIDITEKKQLESQFLRAQRLESLGTLASGIAHDLNNVLTPILSIVQLLPMKLPDLQDHTRLMLKALESSAHRGADLIKQILSFARGVEGNRVDLQVEYLLRELYQILEQTLPKAIEIQTQIPNDLWTVLGDATQLQQVFMNLCVNARDAMPQGGSLQITAENRLLSEQDARLHLDARVGPYVVVTIADTGIGIPPHTLHRIFDPFFTTKDVGKGTGLGLSAVMGITKSHGGFVDVQSQVNRGTQFTIYLPACEANVLPPTPNAELMLGQQELVLVIDDEAPIREITKITLEAYNYRVLTAAGGQEAIALFAQHKVEIGIVLIDMMMPVMDGLSVIPHLQHLNPHTPIVAMSGLNSKEVVAQAAQLGVTRFLPKPFTAQELLQGLALSQRDCLTPN